MAAIFKFISRHRKWLKFTVKKQRRAFTSEAMDIRQLSSKLRDLVTGDRSSLWSGEKGRVSVQSIIANHKLPASQDQLPARKMADSYQEICIPLGSDINLREQYLNFFQMAAFSKARKAQKLRSYYDKNILVKEKRSRTQGFPEEFMHCLVLKVGKLLEDLDILADWIGYLHIYGGREKMVQPSAYTVVTALVDKIDLYDRKILSDQDIIIKGNVTWVGRSSMEVTMQLDQFKADGPGLKHILDAKLLMVARDAANERAAVVNPLVAITEEEKMIFERGQESSNRRQKMAKTSLFRVAPIAEESDMIHNLMLQTTAFDYGVQGMRKSEDSVWMDEELLRSVSVCHPQSRNSHNKVFGGFLMRKAYELSWANACLFSRSCPRVIAIDDIWFRKPVEIGSVLEFTSQVVFTPPQPTNQFEVMTVAEVITPRTGERVTTNVFYNTFDCRDTVPSVLPKTYAEAMKYLDGKRRYEAIK